MKHFIGLVMLLLPLVTFAAPPDKRTIITNNYYVPLPTIVATETVKVDKGMLSDLGKRDATNKAFSALNFERSNKNLQWACGYGFNDDHTAVVCGLGYRVGSGKNGVLLNGATTIGAEEQQGNIGIGGTF